MTSLGDHGGQPKASPQGVRSTLPGQAELCEHHLERGVATGWACQMRWLEKYVIHDTSSVCLGFRLPWATGPQIWCWLPKNKRLRDRAEQQKRKKEEGRGEERISFKRSYAIKLPCAKNTINSVFIPEASLSRKQPEDLVFPLAGTNSNTHIYLCKAMLEYSQKPKGHRQ